MSACVFNCSILTFNLQFPDKSGSPLRCDRLSLSGLGFDANRNGMFQDAVVSIAQGIPVGGLGLPVTVGVGCTGHNGIVTAGVNFP
jgi:hypothetical protein